MRIGLIAPPWIPVPPPAYGGTEEVVDNLCRGLTELGHDVTLFTVGTSTSPVHRHHLFPEAIEPMGQSIPEAAHVLAAYEELADMDVIHDHTVLGALVAARSGIGGPPVVVTNHGLFTPSTRRIFREVARTASVVAISKDQARRAEDVPIEAVIYHGIDLDAYTPGPGDGGYLMFVGRMSPDKGVDWAIRIAREAGVPLRLVSKMRDPEEHEYFDSCVRPLLLGEEYVEELALGPRVEAMGGALGLLNPIRWEEPFGLVMVESMATGTPVIAAPRGAAPELVDHGRTGFLCSTSEQASRAVGLLPAIDRATCRSEVERRFSLHRMAVDHVHLYQRLLRAGPVLRSVL